MRSLLVDLLFDTFGFWTNVTVKKFKVLTIQIFKVHPLLLPCF